MFTYLVSSAMLQLRTTAEMMSEFVLLIPHFSDQLEMPSPSSSKPPISVGYQ